MSIREILFTSTWFGSGVIAMVSMWISDMRNEELDEDYFDVEGILISLLALVFGYASLIGLIVNYCYNYKPFTKFIYKLANIGINSSKKK